MANQANGFLELAALLQHYAEQVQRIGVPRKFLEHAPVTFLGFVEASRLVQAQGLVEAFGAAGGEGGLDMDSAAGGTAAILP